MAEDFWAPIFAKLHENIDLLRSICHDTADSDLISWVKPNPALWGKCARFVSRKKVLNKAGLVDEIIKFATREQSLRKIIFFNWIQRNSKTMNLASLPANDEVFARLEKGEFGNRLKIEIMSRIDPRAGISDFYEKFLCKQPNPEISVTEQPHEEKAQEKIDEPQNQLKQEILTLRRELKNLKYAYESRASEIKGLQKALRSRDDKISTLEDEIENLRESLQKAIIQIIPTQLSQQNKVDNEIEAYKSERLIEISARLENAEKELRKANETIARKDSFINRIQNEIRDLKKVLLSDENKDRQIDYLQSLLMQSESEKSLIHKSGKVINLTDANGKSRWFMQTFSDELIRIPGNLIVDNEICESEFCTAHIDMENHVVAIESLENCREKHAGYLSRENDKCYLISNQETFPVFCRVNEKHFDKPVTGIELKSFLDRPAGIYSLFPDYNFKEEAQNLHVISRKSLASSLNIYEDQVSKLLAKAKAAEIDFLVEHDKISFKVPTFKILSRLRQLFAFIETCEDTECKSALKDLELAKPSQDICEICNKPCKPVVLKDIPDFNGKKVLIVGGDYVGAEYKRRLEKFNLDVTWQSGFQNLGNLRSAINKFELIIVIVRQVSHTVLREIEQAKPEQVPVLYSKNRGLSGLLNEIASFLNK
ncbi:MAG: hypothetical protein Kow0029_14670 [Candidatus Rifleibacteriota bacterium]